MSVAALGVSLSRNSVERRFKSGPDADHPIVIGSYGDSTVRPRLEIDKAFVDDDGNERNNLAVVGLALISFPKIPEDPEFNGADGGALRFVGTGQDILIEDNYVEYGEFIVQNVREVEVRNNVVYRSYHVGTCIEGDPNGDPTFRPSGIFAGSVQGLLIEGNVWDENGWNPDIPEACATIYNHDLYLSGCSDLTVRDNLILRASSIGIKMSSSEPGGSNNIEIAGNVFAEGEIGLSMGGNANTASGEPDGSEAAAWNGEVRNLDSYAEALGYAPTIAAFAEQARMQSRHTFRSELTAPEVAAYIAEGYPE